MHAPTSQVHHTDQGYQARVGLGGVAHAARLWHLRSAGMDALELDHAAWHDLPSGAVHQVPTGSMACVHDAEGQGAYLLEGGTSTTLLGPCSWTDGIDRRQALAALDASRAAGIQRATRGIWLDTLPLTGLLALICAWWTGPTVGVIETGHLVTATGALWTILAAGAFRAIRWDVHRRLHTPHKVPAR